MSDHDLDNTEASTMSTSLNEEHPEVATSTANADADNEETPPAVGRKFPRLPPTQQYITDPQTGERLHWDYGSLTPEQLKRSVPQCDQLCRMCQELAQMLRTHYTTDRLEDTELRHAHHGDLDDLRSSARAGCHLCSQLLRMSFDPFFKNSKRYDILIDLESASIEIFLGAGVDNMYNQWQMLGLSLGFNQEFPLTLAYCSTGSPKVLSLARQWLRKCVEGHNQCRDSFLENSTSKFLPTRLIKVEAKNGVVVSASLYTTPAVPGAMEYLTLSHCWGGGDIIKLTKATLESFKADIPLARLPLTFTDALLVTAYLGFSYIWIDSLCIIQDSIDDWQTESQVMGDVYHYSQCTIAALKAKDSHEGLFSQHSERRSAPCQLLGTEGQGLAVFSRDISWGPSDLSPLHERGWVVQERCLSRRTLNFGDDQISWHCMSKAASERNPSMNNIKQALSADYLRRLFQSILRKLTTCEEYCSEHRVHDWRKIVEQYTSCKLTLATDRLSAVLRLIERVRLARRIRVLHGLLEPHLSTEVLWYTLRVSARVTNDEPTWTWLSIVDGVQHGINNLTGHAKSATLSGHISFSSLVSSSYTQCSSNHFRRMLEVTGELKKVSWDDFSSDRLPSKNHYLIADKPDIYYKLRGFGCGDNIVVPWIGQWYPDTLPDESWDFYAIQIAFDDFRTRKSEGTWYDTAAYNLASFGLVVVPVVSRENIYQRVGYYELFTLKDQQYKHASDDAYMPMKPSSHDVAEHLPCDNKEEILRDCRDDPEAPSTALRNVRLCEHEAENIGFVSPKYCLDPKLYEGKFGSRETIYLI